MGPTAVGPTHTKRTRSPPTHQKVVGKKQRQNYNDPFTRYPQPFIFKLEEGFQLHIMNQIQD